MSCGVACLQMICKYFGKNFDQKSLEDLCIPTTEGVSLLSISRTAENLGFETKLCRITTEQLRYSPLPCVLYWNQNHFVVLYKIQKDKMFYVADPGKGLIKYSPSEFEKHWISIHSQGKDRGIAMYLHPTAAFYEQKGENGKEKHSFRFLFGYVKQYRKYFALILLGLSIGCLLQIIMPFLTQSIVDIGIKNQNVKFIWLILLGELMIVIGRTAIDFIRRWLLLHISMRINISLVSDFFIKLLKLKMSFFDNKLMGDLLQRISDHSRVQSFLTNQVLSVIFSLFSFVILGSVFLYITHLYFVCS